MQIVMQFISMYSAEYLGRSFTYTYKSKLKTRMWEWEWSGNDECSFYWYFWVWRNPAKYNLCKGHKPISFFNESARLRWGEGETSCVKLIIPTLFFLCNFLTPSTELAVTTCNSSGSSFQYCVYPVMLEQFLSLYFCLLRERPFESFVPRPDLLLSERDFEEL